MNGWTGGGRTETTAANGRQRREEEEERGETHPLDVLAGHPDALHSTLTHIVQQLDILTQVRKHM